jgi:hypothetical protein
MTRSPEYGSHVIPTTSPFGATVTAPSALTTGSIGRTSLHVSPRVSVNRRYDPPKLRIRPDDVTAK